ncbi:hypothetical protein H5410_064861 [Solanum commersonii]|uniref:Uncharacterized protein n=1 Tax=Solanum commersonii TaxID=4109 RepID=A0A9J5VY69_SOLCO|nr:hypothetical protein H5410_064861 [Solanum commersonii]
MEYEQICELQKRVSAECLASCAVEVMPISFWFYRGNAVNLISDNSEWGISVLLSSSCLNLPAKLSPQDVSVGDGAGAKTDFRVHIALSMCRYFVVPELENLLSGYYIYFFVVEGMKLWMSRMQLLHGMRCMLSSKIEVRSGRCFFHCTITLGQSHRKTRAVGP